MKRDSRFAKQDAKIAAGRPGRRLRRTRSQGTPRGSLPPAPPDWRARADHPLTLPSTERADWESIPLTELQDSIVALVAEWGYERRDEAFTLSAGHVTHDYIDGKRAIAQTSRLRLVAQAFLELAKEEGVEFDAVGGLTMGADPIALAIAVGSDRDTYWFSVRKEPKEHGKQQLIEGGPLLPGTRVLLVDDVVTTGRSIIQALDAIQASGAEVVMASALVDRGEGTSRVLDERGIRYRPMMTYQDLGIEPVPDRGPIPA